MTFEIHTPIVNDGIPFDISIGFDGTDATVGAVAAGSSRKLEITTLRGVRVLGAALHLNKWNTVTAATTNFGINLYATYKTPDNVAETAVALTAPIKTNSTTAIAQDGGNVMIPLIDDHLVDPTTDTDLIASSGFGALKTGGFDSTGGTSFGIPIMNPLSNKFQQISFGIEVTGGEDTKGIVCGGKLQVWGLRKGSTTPVMFGGDASYVCKGDGVSYDATNGGWDGTLAAAATYDLQAE